jgi:hypothetical protein
LRGRSALLFCATLALAGVACGSGDGPSCPRDFPPACPSPAPTFAADAQPVFQSKCQPCHEPGGQKADVPLTTWAQIHSRITTVVSLVNGCQMPPPGAPPLTSDERAALLGWFACNATDN